MANSFTSQIVQQGPRNALVKLTGVLDTSNLAATAAFSLADLDQVDTGATPTGVAILEVEFSVSDGLNVQLLWDATTDVVAVTMSQSGEFHFYSHGGLQNNAGTGKTGVINVATTGYSSGTASFTVLLKLLKQGTSL